MKDNLKESLYGMTKLFSLNFPVIVNNSMLWRKSAPIIAITFLMHFQNVSLQCTYHLIRLYHRTFIIVLTITNVNKLYYIINEFFLYVHLPNISNTLEMQAFGLKGWGIFVWSLWRHKLYKLFEISNIEYLHCNIYVQLSARPNICNLE